MVMNLFILNDEVKIMYILIKSNFIEQNFNFEIKIFLNDKRIAVIVTFRAVYPTYFYI